MSARADAERLRDDTVRAATSARITRGGLSRAARAVIPTIAWVGLTLFAFVASTRSVQHWLGVDAIGFDFDGTLWEPAIDIREGRSPFPEPTTAQVDVNNPALYPPFLPLLVVPLTALPSSVGLAAWIVFLGASVALALYALGVRDIRCYLVAFVSAPVVTGVALGNATILLVPLIAFGWRWRNRAVTCGILVGVAIAAKLFLVPLLVWLLGTRRYKAAASAAVTAVAAVILPWAFIGLDGFTAYPTLLRLASEIYGPHSVSLTTILSAVGVDTTPAIYAAGAVAFGLAALAFVVGRRAMDEASIAIAVLAAIVSSPIVWEYYYALLLVPVAIVWPRLSLAWALIPLFSVASALSRPLLTSADIEPGGPACCPPDGVPELFWTASHSPPGLWPALGQAAVAAVLVVLVWRGAGAVVSPGDCRRSINRWPARNYQRTSK